MRPLVREGKQCVHFWTASQYKEDTIQGRGHYKTWQTAECRPLQGSNCGVPSGKQRQKKEDLSMLCISMFVSLMCKLLLLFLHMLNFSNLFKGFCWKLCYVYHWLCHLCVSYFCLFCICWIFLICSRVFLFYVFIIINFAEYCVMYIDVCVFHV
jgi:hypothetical protein